MKYLIVSPPMCLFCTILGSFILLFACNAPQSSDYCNSIAINNQLPEPVVRKISVSGQEKKTDNLIIGALEEDLVIELQPAAVDSYFFKLNIKGLSPCGTGTRFPEMRYTFLPGGAHELEYWTQKEGLASKHKILYFYVAEAMTEKGWFYPAVVAYLLLIAGAIVYFWALYNIRQKLKMQHIRSRIAADLHDEVSSDLSSIAISMITLERRNTLSPIELNGVMQEIKQTLADTQNNLSDTVWAIKPDKDSDGELFQRMHKFAQQMFAAGDTRLTFLNTIPPHKTFRISMEQRHNIFKIYKEAIHNIYKHARATEVEVKIYQHPDGLGIEVQDNGIGFNPAAEHDGSGINNYHWRAKENLITFQLESAPGKGTRIKMTIPQF